MGGNDSRKADTRTSRKRINTMTKIWTIWKYAIGSFNDEKTKDYDNYIAIIRTFVVSVNVICAFFIMANIIHNW